jgi:hypothetical protein
MQQREVIEALPRLRRSQLEALCQMLGVPRGCRGKIGRWHPYRAEELCAEIRRWIGHGETGFARLAGEVEAMLDAPWRVWNSPVGLLTEEIT